MSASEFLTPFVSAEASLLRQSRFWILQLAGWLLINLLYFWDFIYRTARETPGPGPELVIATSCVMSIACSTVLAAAYLRMPRRWLTGARAIPVVLGLSLLAVLPWTTAMDLVERATYPFQFRQGFGLDHFLSSSVLMIWWSVAFLWFMLNEQVEGTQVLARHDEALALAPEPSAPTPTDGAIDEARDATPNAATQSGALSWKPHDRVRLQEANRVQFWPIRDIAYIRAAGDYTEVHLTTGQVALVKQRLRHWELRLPESFVRIHRSTLVNLEHSEALVHIEGAWQIRLQGCPEPLSVSRRLAQTVKARIAGGKAEVPS